MVPQLPRASNRFSELRSPEWLQMRFRQGNAHAHAGFRLVRERLDPLGVLQDLGWTHRVELVALVLALDSHAMFAPADREVRRQQRKAKREAVSRGRSMRRRVDHIVDRLNKLADERDSYDDYFGMVLLGDAEARIPPDEHLSTAAKLRDEAKAYAKMRLLTREEVETGEPDYPDWDVSVPAVRNHLTIRLFNYFADRCGFSKNESNKRTTRIINALLGGHLRLVDQPEHSDQRPGSETVRSRVRRHSRKKVS
jgi:hypothetical protein